MQDLLDYVPENIKKDEINDYRPKYEILSWPNKSEEIKTNLLKKSEKIIKTTNGIFGKNYSGEIETEYGEIMIILSGSIKINDIQYLKGDFVRIEANSSYTAKTTNEVAFYTCQFFE